MTERCLEHAFTEHVVACDPQFIGQRLDVELARVLRYQRPASTEADVEVQGGEPRVDGTPQPPVNPVRFSDP